tara:strand:+ start:46 stop:912 length:867 start_codon:yes stop_codon:yes gene_type:complete
MIRLLPITFILLWSSAFITSKIIVLNATPFASLTIRFIIVTVGFFLFIFYLKEKIFVKYTYIYQACITGILFHGFYLGGVFFSIYIGLPANIAALIVSLQPILTNILAGPILNEEVTWNQWLGISLGFLGTVFVLGFDLGNSISFFSLIACIVSLIALTTATLWQKKLSYKLPLSTSNFYQALGASIFLFLIMIIFEKPYINFNSNFILSMSWQIIFISFGAFSILMYLIKIGTASQTSNLFFLVPSISALMAWLFLDEIITSLDILGLLISSFGVYIATTNKKLNNM